MALSSAASVEAITFHSERLKLAGTLYTPEGSRSNRVPAVVAGAGWGGTKDRGLAQFATRS